MPEGKFIISAQNQIKAGLDAAQRDLDSFKNSAKTTGDSVKNNLGKSATDTNSAVEKLGDTLRTAFTATAIIAGIKKIADAAFDCYKEFGIMDRQVQQLKIALDNNETSINMNSELIETLSKKTLAGKGDVRELVIELAALGKSDEDIKKVATAAVNLSNVTGQDLKAAFTQINATFSGTTGRLAQIIPEVKDFSKEQLAAGDAVDLINTKLGTLSDQLAENNVPQKLKNFSDAWGDLKENFGMMTASVFNPIVEGLNAIIDGWNNAATAQQLYAQLGAQTTALEKKNALEKLIAIKEAEIEKQKAYKTTLELTDLTGFMQSFDTQVDEKIRKQQAEVEKLKGQLANVKNENPQLFITPAPRVTYNGGQTIGEGGTGGDPEQTKTLKANYKTVEAIEKDLLQFVSIMENHPDYYSTDKIQSFIDSARSRIYAAETLTLGPEATEILNDVRTLFQSLELSIPEKIATSLASSSLSIQDQNWSKNIEGLARASVSASDMARAYGEKNNLPAAMAELKAWLFPEVKTLKDYTTSGASNALSVSDQNWSKNIEGLARASVSASDMARIYGEMHSIPDAIADSIRAKQLYFSPNVSNSEDEAALAALGKLGDKLNISQYSLARNALSTPDQNWSSNMLGNALASAIAALPEIQITNQVVDALKTLFPNITANGTSSDWTSGTSSGSILGLSDITSPGISGGLSFKTQPISTDTTSPVTIFDKIFNSITGNLDALSTSLVQAGLKNDIAAGKATLFGKLLEKSGEAVEKFKNDLIATADALKSSYSDALSSVLSSASSGLTSSITDIISALGPFGDMLAGMNPILALLLPIIEGFSSVMSSGLTSLLEPLMDALAGLGESIGEEILPLFDALYPIISLLATIIQTNVTPIIEALSPTISVVSSILEALTPIIALVAKAMVYLNAPIEWVTDMLTALGTNIGILIYNLTHWLRQKAYVDFTSDAFANIDDLIASIDALSESTNSISSSVDTSTTTSSTSASYRTQNITINIYQEAPVVGSDGMTEFARMIRDEIAELDYLGT